jgi:MFS family permease
MFTSFWDLGVAAGSVSAGFIAGQLGYPMIYALMGVPALLCAGGVLAMWMPRLKAAASPR